MAMELSRGAVICTVRDALDFLINVPFQKEVSLSQYRASLEMLMPKRICVEKPDLESIGNWQTEWVR